MSTIKESTPILNYQSNIVGFDSFTGNTNSSFDILCNDLNYSADDADSTIKGIDILQISKQRILRPIKIFHHLIGWRTCLIKSNTEDTSNVQKAFTIVYLLSFILTLLLTHFHQFIDCVRISDKINSNLSEDTGLNGSVTCSHINVTYFLPSILHVLAYFFGLYYFYRQGLEELCGIVEKILTYILTIPVTSRSPKRVLLKLEIVSIGGICLLAAIVANNIYREYLRGPANFHLIILNYLTGIRKKNFDFLVIIFSLIGQIVMNLVTFLLLIKFILYCDLLHSYCSAVLQQLMMRIILIKEAKQEIYNIHTLIIHLNESMGIITTVILLMLVSIIAINIKVVLGYDQVSNGHLVCHTINLVLLLFVIFVTIYQAIRVNKMIKKLSMISLKMNTYGYRNVSALDLQSFSLFIMGNKFHVELFAMPMIEKYFLFLVIILITVFVVVINCGNFDKIKF